MQVGAVKITVAVPELLTPVKAGGVVWTALVIAGAGGTTVVKFGVTLLEAAEGKLVPAALVAVTVKV